MSGFQQVRLVIDRCQSAVTVRESAVTTWGEEDRRPCEAVGETPGDAHDVDVVLPLQLGGRVTPDSEYPRHVMPHGFRGCIKNFVHNGQVCHDSAVTRSYRNIR